MRVLIEYVGVRVSVSVCLRACVRVFKRACVALRACVRASDLAA